MNSLNITDDFLLIVDSNTHKIIDTIQFSLEFKFVYNDGKGPTKFYSIENKNVFFEHPYLKGGQFVYGDLTINTKSKAKKHYGKITSDSASDADIPIIGYDMMNSSKMYVEAELVNSGYVTKIYLLLSGIRYRDASTCYVDVYDEQERNLYINIPVSDNSTKGLYTSSKKQASVDISNIPTDSLSTVKYNQQSKRYHNTIKISNDFSVLQDVIVSNLEKPKVIQDEEKKQRKMPFDSYSAVWKTAWDAAGLVANKEIAIVPFGKQFKEAFTKKFTAYVGFDKSRGSALEFSFNEDKFFTRDEMKELIDKYNVFNNLDNSIDTKGNGMYINDGGIVIKNSMNAVSINDEGIDIDNLRLNTSVQKSSSGIIPVETETVASNDIRPVSNLMLTAPRRIPNIYKLKKTFDVMYALTKMSIDIAVSVNKQIGLYNEYKSRVEKEQKEASEESK